MKADVLARALDAASSPDDTRPRLLMTPRGMPLTQARVATLARGPGAVILCGRFEGVDERIIEARNFSEVSIGDYVLSGGEIAAAGPDRRLRPAAARRHGPGGLRPTRRASPRACSNTRNTRGRRCSRAAASRRC